MKEIKSGKQQEKREFNARESFRPVAELYIKQLPEDMTEELALDILSGTLPKQKQKHQSQKIHEKMPKNREKKLQKNSRKNSKKIEKKLVDWCF